MVRLGNRQINGMNALLAFTAYRHWEDTKLTPMGRLGNRTIDVSALASFLNYIRWYFEYNNNLVGRIDSIFAHDSARLQSAPTIPVYFVFNISLN